MNQPNNTFQVKWYPPLQKKTMMMKPIHQVILNECGFLFGLALRATLLQHVPADWCITGWEIKQHVNRSDIKKFLDPVLHYKETLMGSSLVLLILVEIHPVFYFLLFCRVLHTNKPTSRRLKTQPPLVEVITGKWNIFSFFWPQVRKIVNCNHILLWKKQQLPWCNPIFRSNSWPLTLLFIGLLLVLHICVGFPTGCLFCFQPTHYVGILM